MSLGDNWISVRERVSKSAAQVGRDPSEIIIIAVTKYASVMEINELIRAGAINIGENRVQDAAAKFPLLTGKVVKHLIGTLQTNKVKLALATFDLIQSVDRPELVIELAKQANKEQRNIEFLIQLNISGEVSKHGLPREQLPELLKQISEYHQLVPCGLMTIAPQVDNPQTVRPIFRSMKEIFEEVAIKNKYGAHWRYLSMGMSQDFEVAVEEGANLLRIGTAIFK